MQKKLSVFLFVLMSSFCLIGCSENFRCLDCKAPQEQAPSIDADMVHDFAKQKVFLVPVGNTLKIILPADVFFRVNTPTLKTNRNAALNNVAALLKRYGSTATVRIEGFTDAVANKKASQTLALEQARAIQAYLWTCGLDAEHLYAAGLGLQQPVGEASDVFDNAANRRVEIVVHSHCTTCF